MLYFCHKNALVILPSDKIISVMILQNSVIFLLDKGRYLTLDKGYLTLDKTLDYTHNKSFEFKIF